MQSSAQPPSVSPEALKRRHEAADPPAALIAPAAAVLLLIAASVAIVWLMLLVWTRARPLDAAIRLRGTIIAPNNELLERFPKPNLQINGHTDLAAFLKYEDAELTNYGWINRKAGVVRLPINRAMDLIAQRGLPTRAAGAVPATGGSEFELATNRMIQP